MKKNFTTDNDNAAFMPIKRDKRHKDVKSKDKFFALQREAKHLMMMA